MQIFLSIVGDDLDPAMVSATLGGPPHQAGRKGDPINATMARGRIISRPAIAGYWQRMTAIDSRVSVDEAVRDVFSGLTGEGTIWQTLGSQFRVRVTVHGAPSFATAQMIFASSTLAFFEERGLQIHLTQD